MAHNSSLSSPLGKKGRKGWGAADEFPSYAVCEGKWCFSTGSQAWWEQRFKMWAEYPEQGKQRYCSTAKLWDHQVIHNHYN